MTCSAHTDPKPIACVLLAALLVLAGCLQGPSGPQPETSEPERIEPTNQPGNTTDDSGQPGQTSAPSDEDPDNGTDDQVPPGPRTVEHAAGQTTIEGRTDRVVALEFNHVENLLALGIQPVGVADKEGYETWVDVGIELDDDVVDVGTRAEPSLETIADLEPELILAVEFRHEDVYDQLSRIAPTLLFDAFPASDEQADQYDRMLDIFERTAKATARTDEATDVRKDLDEHYQTLEDHLSQEGQTGREILLSQLFTYNGQPLARVFLEDSIGANVAERIGLENAWNKEACSTGYGYCDVSKEGFADVQDADFFYQAQTGDDPVQDEWSNDPVWNSYAFVREDRVYPVGAQTWMFGGPLMSQEIADRIAQHLLDRG